MQHRRFHIAEGMEPSATAMFRRYLKRASTPDRPGDAHPGSDGAKGNPKGIDDLPT